MRTTVDEQLICQLELLFYEVRNDTSMDWATHEINRMKSHYQYNVRDMRNETHPEKKLKLSYMCAYLEDVIRAFVLHRDYKRAIGERTLWLYRKENKFLGYNDPSRP
jgi:hypothetical protein